MVGQISFPQYSVNSAVDPSQWATLGNLGNVYRDAQSNAAKQATLAQLGPDIAANANLLISSGNPELAAMGLRLQQQAQTYAREDVRYGIEDKFKERQVAVSEAGAKQDPAEVYDKKLKVLEKMRVDINSPAAQKYLSDPTGAYEPPGASSEAGLTPVWGSRVNPATGQEEAVLLQMNKSGSAVETKLPPGVTANPKLISQDVGNEIIWIDPGTRQIVKRAPKNFSEKVIQETTAEAQAKAAINLPTVEHNAAIMTKVIEEAVGHPGKNMSLGPFASRLPTVTKSQADFRAAVAQLEGGAFLEAYTVLRGSGAITDIEGKKATEAKLRASQAQSVEAFDKAMNAYKEIIATGVQNYRNLARGGVSTGQGSGADDAISQANAAIAQGANPKAVRQRLIQQGVDPGRVGLE